MTGHDFAVVRAALAALPDRCRYHFDRLDLGAHTWAREACCDTDGAAQRRKLAEEALRRLEQDAGPAVDTAPRYCLICGDPYQPGLMNSLCALAVVTERELSERGRLDLR